MADLGLTHAQIGVLIGVSFIVAFALGLPVVGVLADRVRAAAARRDGPRRVERGHRPTARPRASPRSAPGVRSSASARRRCRRRPLAMLGDRFPPRAARLRDERLLRRDPGRLRLSLAFSAAGRPPARLARVLPAARPRRPRGGDARVAHGRPAPARLPGGRRPPAPAPTPAQSAIEAAPRSVLAPSRCCLCSWSAAALLAFTSAASQHVDQLARPRARLPVPARRLALAALLASRPALGNLGDRRAHGPGPPPRDGGPALRVRGARGGRARRLPAASTRSPRHAALLRAWLVAQAWVLGWYGPVVAAMHEMAPPDSRATVVGFTLLVVNLLGVATGPWVTGLIADRISLTHRPHREPRRHGGRSRPRPARGGRRSPRPLDCRHGARAPRRAGVLDSAGPQEVPWHRTTGSPGS